MLDRAILTKFLTHRESLQSKNRVRLSDFDEILDRQGISAELPSLVSNNFCLAQNGGHFEFSNFSQKLRNTENAKISKTVLDRAISTKFLTHRVSLQSKNRVRLSDFDEILDRQGISAELPSLFSKNFCLAQSGGHFQFSNFSQKLQNTKMLISRKPC